MLEQANYAMSCLSESNKRKWNYKTKYTMYPWSLQANLFMRGLVHLCYEPVEALQQCMDICWSTEEIKKKKEKETNASNFKRSCPMGTGLNNLPGLTSMPKMLENV